MTNPVEAAIQAAKEQAAKNAPIEMVKTNLPANTGNGNAVASYAPAMPATLDMLMNSSVSVDEWLKVDKYGLLIGEMKKPIDKIKVTIDTREGAGFTAFYGVRFGNPATYFKSYDRSQCVQGGSWDAALQRAQKADDKCKGEYQGVDMVMTALEDIKDTTGKVVLEAGKTLGHSTSITGTKPVVAFMKEMRLKGLLGETLDVEISVTERNGNGNTWGVLALELIGVHQDSETEE